MKPTSKTTNTQTFWGEENKIVPKIFPSIFSFGFIGTVELMNVQLSIEAFLNPSYWSFIKDTSGSITIVMPGCNKAAI